MPIYNSLTAENLILRNLFVVAKFYNMCAEGYEP